MNTLSRASVFSPALEKIVVDKEQIIVMIGLCNLPKPSSGEILAIILGITGTLNGFPTPICKF
jgi:hypothetical protein